MGAVVVFGATGGVGRHAVAQLPDQVDLRPGRLTGSTGAFRSVDNSSLRARAPNETHLWSATHDGVVLFDTYPTLLETLSPAPTLRVDLVRSVNVLDSDKQLGGR